MRSAHNEPCATHGLVWTLCTLAGLVVLLGPAFLTTQSRMYALKGLLALSVPPQRLSVRTLACAVWRLKNMVTCGWTSIAKAV